MERIYNSTTQLLNNPEALATHQVDHTIIRPQFPQPRAAGGEKRVTHGRSGESQSFRVAGEFLDRSKVVTVQTQVIPIDFTKFPDPAGPIAAR